MFAKHTHNLIFQIESEDEEDDDDDDAELTSKVQLSKR